MDLNDYQALALQTDVRPQRELEDTVVHLLGLAGEAGSVAAEYKKHLRDGKAHGAWRERMAEELGDVLWYLAAIADRLDLRLADIAAANLAKTRARWIPGFPAPFDESFPENERLPRSGVYEFRAVPETEVSRPSVDLFFNGLKVGDRLTDASDSPDGYRFHDVFHLAFATFLGWSPLTRALLGRKRRSDRIVDENQDGGRAVVLEEGISALAFAYGAEHGLLDGVEHVDQSLIGAIDSASANVEVADRTGADWERAILAGFKVFRELLAHDGGFVAFDADAGQLEFMSEKPVTSD
ncbi:MazG nucleotide pyrophosphohydrolase domain [Mycobacteroides abscessus]|nr:MULTISPECIES: nucleoside triphosphate pyrophosphohydrolase family protein [Mycobacteriaceae]MDO3136742.1 MazG nucleotide pyrophosphohydrolase domain-containing protein [Mycobacteroides abscessus subsp. abscessus]MDO3152032.1 MazG nucleotide pyrophosphohydrolase domain-containing protein [Mycobacteroides abscessus subsp. abscessus]CPU27573.1 MazG nucleotide pyrophosphohydrolase domain [Mycobacteroides abscessus]CPU28746.1 MazG nucleotide pyrophosphohydrolase domain [Mycobacteroides abscessus]